MKNLSIRKQLLILVASIAIPMVAILVYTIYDNNRQRMVQEGMFAKRFSLIAAFDVARVLETNRELLAQIAKRPLIKAMDEKRCDNMLLGFKELFPKYANMSVVNIDGVTICSSAPQPSGKQVSVAKEEWFKRSLQEKSFVVGKPFLDTFTGRSATVLGYPIIDDSQKLVGFLRLSLDLALYEPNFSAVPLPTDTTVGVLTSEGIVIWRNKETEKWVGKSGMAVLAVRQILSVKDGEVTAMGIDGVDRFFSVTPVAGMDWYAYIGIPLQSIREETEKKLIKNISLAGFALVFLIGFAIFIARRIEEPIHRLALVAQSISNGNNDIRVGIEDGAPEILEVANEFNEMLDVRMRTENQLRRHKEDLEETVEQRTVEVVLAKEQAEAASRAKSIFLANMSHELRTPLNAVLGFSRLMKNDKDISEGQRKTLDIINSSGEYLLTLINNILDISKIESGRMLIEESSLDLVALLHEIQSLMGTRAQEKGLALSLRQSQDLPRYVSLDGGKLQQILLNLVGNAIKFTCQGEVTVNVMVVHWDSPETVRLRFEVRDSGIGIPKEDLNRIFSPFEQSGINATKEAGTGLGLAICVQYVKLLGGFIGVESEVGKGSIFYFELPVKIVDAPLEFDRGVYHGNVIGIAEGQSAYRLLVAEDQPENRLLLLKLLEPFGFELMEAVNGREAVDICEQWKPHLIWMDIRMPIMNGLDATKHIRQTQYGKSIKIIALTAHTLEEERLEILNAGCDDFIRKPYRESEIYEALQRYLGIVFVYDENPYMGVAPKSKEVYLAGLSRLTRQMQEELFEALELLDEDMSLSVIDKIATMDDELAQALRLMIKNMHYKKLLVILDEILGGAAI